MPRANKSRRGKKSASSSDAAANDNSDEAEEDNNDNNSNNGSGRQLPEHVRSRQRAVAEREADRLARPERRTTSTLGHADRKKSAVASTPFGFLAKNSTAAAAADTETTWCGPFTVARQMIAARDQAKRKREADLAEEEENNNENGTSSGGGTNHPLDAIMAQVEEEKRQAAHPSLLWKSRAAMVVSPAPDSKQRNSKRARLPQSLTEDETQNNNYNRVPSLYQLCVDFVVTNFEHVESLGQVDHDIRTSIAHSLASDNRLNALSLEALVEQDMEALELVDCADIPQPSLVDAIHKAPTLRYLLLDQAGRCFGPTVVHALLNPFELKSIVAQSTSTSKPVPLFALHIGGAYLLTDADAATIITTMAPTLQSLAWKASPLLGLQMCQSILVTFSQQQHTLLEFSLEDMALKRESWDALIGGGSSDQDRDVSKKDNNDRGKGKDMKLPWQRNLKSLTLRGVGGLQDDIVISLLKGAPELEHVDLSDNHELTDACLGPLRSSDASITSSLRSLALYNLKNITNIGLEALFTHGLEGMGPPPLLKRLNLSHMHVDAVTDEVMELVLQSASRKPTGKGGAAGGSSATIVSAAAETVAHSGLSLLGGMVKVELQGAAITDTTLEQLAVTSANTLEHLNVSFCPHISDKGLGYLVDSVGNQLEGVQIWGCAQITEEFWNGHARVVEGGRKSSSSNDPHAVVPLRITGAWMKRSGIASIRS